MEALLENGAKIEAAEYPAMTLVLDDKEPIEVTKNDVYKNPENL